VTVLPAHRVIDLTLPLRRGMRGVDWEPKCSVERDGWNATTLHLYSHAGTHMDAQVHFAAGPETIDRIPLDRCCGVARVVHLPATGPKERLTPAHLGAVSDTFRRGEVLLLATGWSRFVDDPAVYRNGLPRVGEELARWCVARGARVLGVEPPSVADVSDLDEMTRVHHVLLGGGVTVVEGLTNLNQLRDGQAWFVAAPLPIVGGDGCPCRAFAIVPDHNALTAGGLA
jgi:kynurenine formamidase